jgi:hypothetical protein
MLKNKRLYISLVEGSAIESPTGDFQVNPQSRVVQLSGSGWGWVWNQPTGVVIRQKDEEHRIPVINFTRIITFLLYGVSVFLVVLGLLKPRSIQRGA